MRAQLQTLHASIETVANARRSWSTRSSVRIILESGEGHVGLGEAAPLAGFSPESAADAREALAKVEWPERPPTSIAAVRAIVNRIDAALPSARFAAETALTSLMASFFGVPLWALYTDEAYEVPLAAALLADDVASIEAAAKEAAAFGMEAVKIKVGRNDRQTERALLTIVRDVLPDAELRLDANGSFAPDAIDERLAELARFAPAFLEEPAPLEVLLEQNVSAPFPLAVDESLAGDPEARLDEALTCDAVGVVVLKPTLLGGIGRCWSLAQRARRAGRAVVISHTLEGVIARAACAHLAVALGGPAAGLGDHAALELLSDGLIAGWIGVGWIEPPDLPGLGLDVAW